MAFYAIFQFESLSPKQSISMCGGVDCWTTLDFLVTCWIGTSALVYYRRGLKRLTKLGSESSGISECFSKPDIHSPGGKDPRAETRSGSASR